MNFTRFIILSAGLLLQACHAAEKKKQPAGRTQVKPHSVAILPFRETDTAVLNQVSRGITQQLAVKVTILPEAGLPAFAFYQPRQRYIADSLLVYLKASNKGAAEKIMGITSKDISTKKGDVENWGVLGLGSCPGEACVISTFRAGKDKVSYQQYIRRMITLALHELGHTYGLDHCTAEQCLMKDARGKMNLDDAGVYCGNCQKYLSARGLLRVVR